MSLSRRNASVGRAPVRPHAAPAAPLRYLTDDELSEAIDADREHAHMVLHADWPPTTLDDFSEGTAGGFLLPAARASTTAGGSDSRRLAEPTPRPSGVGMAPGLSGTCTVPVGPRRPPMGGQASGAGDHRDHNDERRAA